MRRRWIGVVISVILLACLVSPFVETAVHSNGNIFTSGQDNETTVALLTLCIALALAVSCLVWSFCAATRCEVRLTLDTGPANAVAYLCSPDPDASPPLTLRI